MYANPPKGSNVTLISRAQKRIFKARHKNVNILLFEIKAHAKINKLGRAAKNTPGNAFNMLSISSEADCELLIKRQAGSVLVVINRSFVGIFMAINVELTGAARLYLAASSERRERG
ncbi:hypothetical protein [Azotobacter chroococcum]|uniref:hypothetical protein n=1 Tax=Azotobacter chroococcum TaxID=353 RepID=UPI0013F1538F|nr:hypothetical protein [Azotobacter chroococcum]